ncbi:MAG: PQQ-dependent sugar dehydrogenase [Phycisphaerales bacterium]|nr:PQQ-dependent sugar dehydrogenase [Phycisphaerales bacterium]
MQHPAPFYAARSSAGAALAITLAALVVIGGCPRRTPPDGPLAVRLQRIATGLSAPVDLVPAPDSSGRLFIVEQPGRIRVLTAEGELRDTPFLDLTEKIVALRPFGEERGLTSMTFHPAYASNGRLFVCYSAPPSAETTEGFDSQSIIAEFRVNPADGNLADPASERVILRIAQPQANHNGGQIAFGKDGYLYIGSGDGGAAGDAGLGHDIELGNGQDKRTLLGKILRIDVDGAQPYVIPADNPFVGVAGAAPEIFALGFRNPWRFSVDSRGRLFVADVGQAEQEEVNLVERGGNYGWRIREGVLCFGSIDGTCPSTDVDGAPLIEPILSYGHAGEGPLGKAVIGGYFYEGSAVSVLKNRYVFGDFTAGFASPDGMLFAAIEDADGRWTFDEIRVADNDTGRINRFILAFGRDAAGELYVLASSASGPLGTSGEVYKLLGE